MTTCLCCDLHLRGNFWHGSHAVVLREGVVVENDPLGQPQLVRLGSVGRVRVNVGHVLMCQNEVVSRSVHVSSNLPAGERHCRLHSPFRLRLEADFINTDISRPRTCMKKPASRALFRLWLLVLVPKDGSEMGSSILFRVSVNSDRMASAVFREEWDRKLSWHQFSALASKTIGKNRNLDLNSMSK